MTPLVPACFDLFWVIRTMIGVTKVERADCSALQGNHGESVDRKLLDDFAM